MCKTEPERHRQTDDLAWQYRTICYADRGRVTACFFRPSVSPSVCLLWHFRYCDHIGWNTTKIILRLIIFRFLLALTPTWAISSNGNTPKLGWKLEQGWVMTRKTCSGNGCKIGPRLLWRTNRSLVHAFDLYWNHWPWMTLNGRNALLQKNLLWCHPKKFNDARPIGYYQRQNVGRWF